MIELFHGSQIEVPKPVFGLGRNDCDYGSGFYLCEDFEMASMWASQYKEGGYVNHYRIDLSSLRVLWLNHDTQEDILAWVALLCANRIDSETRESAMPEVDYLTQNHLPNLENVDVIVGYRADDSYYQYTRAFLTNQLPIELLKEAMEAGKLGLQYALHSQRSFRSLEFLSSTKVPYGSQYRRLEEQASLEYEKLFRKRTPFQTYLRDIIRGKR